MVNELQTIRGMYDLLPNEIPAWQYVESTVRSVLTEYGYQEIRTPIVESTLLFQRGVGEHTDIVEKEMYTFMDRNSESLTLRPEFTASIVRSGIQHSLFYNQIQKLWTLGPLFRYERPQKGRCRQFHQFSIEVFGLDDVVIEAELLLLNARLWRMFNMQDAVTLELNTLGTHEERVQYREALVAYLTQHKNKLDGDSQRRLKTNPMRILDSKNEVTREIVQSAPRLHDYLGQDSLQSFNRLRRILDHNGIDYTINPTLVRGLDYYCKTVFEWTTSHLGAQGTISAGGRYDPLIEILGGKATPGCGFAIGIERLVLLLKTLERIPPTVYHAVDLALVATGHDEILAYALAVAETMRHLCPALKLQTVLEGSLKSQMKRADRSGAVTALIIGEDEWRASKVTVKSLRQHVEQVTCSVDEAAHLVNVGSQA